MDLQIYIDAINNGYSIDYSCVDYEIINLIREKLILPLSK